MTVVLEMTDSAAEVVVLGSPALAAELAALEAASYARLSDKPPRDVRMVIPYRAHRNPLLETADVKAMVRSVNDALEAAAGGSSSQAADSNNAVDERLLNVLADRRLQLAAKYVFT